MIKKTMYFYDEKQANVIKNVNDKLHRQRGVKITDEYIPLSQLNPLSYVRNINKNINSDKHIEASINKIEKLLKSVKSIEQHKEVNGRVQSEARAIQMYINSLIDSYKRMSTALDDVINRM